MTKGVVLFGVNNTHIDYVQLAVMAAGFIRKNMPGTPIALITDAASRDWHASKGKWRLDLFFDYVILLPENTEQVFENTRPYRDTRYHSVDASFKNETRSTVYQLTPFDETLLVDVDYIIANNALSTVWGSSEDFLINKNANMLQHRPLMGPEFRLNPYGIRMYWATVIYFKKSEKARLIFDLVEHVKDNWEYYVMLYEMPGKLFRNDYAFSIAIHILNGLVDSEDIVKDLPIPTIHTALDLDQFYKIQSPKDLLFFVNDLKDTWKFYVTKLSGVNVHCMNKLSLLNQMDEIMEHLQ